MHGKFPLKCNKGHGKGHTNNNYAKKKIYVKIIKLTGKEKKLEKYIKKKATFYGLGSQCVCVLHDFGIYAFYRLYGH